ncbi:DNA replication factor C complex subunit Rfc1 [Coemansia sp. RSA 1722]|nr:DNA replication factor C complex subunit Rfc1 [Coemansia sp. RSA 485]KAJ2590341.1 DNA replication factor C complex subunit Rfc1 [Coemansia sp. RSA 1722]
MPRASAASSTPSASRKRKVPDSEEEEIDPATFFATPKPEPSAAKSKAKAKPKPKAKGKTEDAAGNGKRAVSLDEIGFPASELPDVAPKKFSYAMLKNGGSGAGGAELDNMPEGAPNCLEGLKFVVTGEFTGMNREQITDLIKTFGGMVASAVSGKTSYLVVGDDPGSGKVKKAKAMKTRCLYEKDLMLLIRSSKTEEDPVKQDEAPEIEVDQPEPSVVDEPETAVDHQEELPEPSIKTETQMETSPKRDLKPAVPAAEKETLVKTEPKPVSAKAAGKSAEPVSSSVGPKSAADPSPSVRAAPVQSDLWTDKYKPTKLKELCGHKTSAMEIMKWLSWWAEGGIPEKRAVLISGPPGIGKTTTAHLVAKLSGFDVFELNASETRSKNTLKDMLGAAISNRSVLEFDRRALKKLQDQQDNEDDTDVISSTTVSGAKRLVIIMDEVDGMSGGDRGGSTELIQLIKRTHVPIICICNDRMSPKVRSLANYCEDMRFRRPTEQQMRARLNTIAFRENLKIEPNAISQLVKSTHNDIRQIINLMSSYALNKGSMSYMESKAYTKLNRKEVAMGPFDVIGKYLNGMENSSTSFSDKVDMYYSDFSIMPLFVQENYIDNRPGGTSNSADELDCLSRAADMIAEADVVENKLRGSQQWGLMPLHAVLSCVGPAFHVRGGHQGMYRFPGWLGQNSKGSKLSRYLNDVQSHMRLRVSADKTEIRKSYIPAMVPELINPLVKQGTDGVPDVIAMMDHYYLSKDHWDAMVELHLDGERMLKRIPTAVKSAFTREYKKGSHPVAFNTAAGASSAKAVQAAASASLKPDTEDYVDDDEGGDEAVLEDLDDDDGSQKSGDALENDALIAAAKPKPKGRAKAATKAKGAAAGESAPTRKKRKTK